MEGGSSRLCRVLAHRLKHEQLCGRRVAICQRAMAAAENRLAALDQQERVLRQSVSTSAIATIQWHQHRQRTAQALRWHIEKTEQLRHGLAERMHGRRAELVGAAQMRRATETALARRDEESRRATRRAADKHIDELVRAKLISRTVCDDAITT